MADGPVVNPQNDTGLCVCTNRRQCPQNDLSPEVGTPRIEQMATLTPSHPQARTRSVWRITLKYLGILTLISLLLGCASLYS